MRFDKEIKFLREGESEYDETTGNYSEPYFYETKALANITNAGTDTTNLIYGQIKQGALVIRIQNYYGEPYDYIEYNSKRYKVDFTRKLQNIQTFVVSEVQ